MEELEGREGSYREAIMPVYKHLYLMDNIMMKEWSRPGMRGEKTPGSERYVR